MKTVIYLRIASVLTLIHGVMHTVGGVYGKPSPGAQQAAVTAMKANTFLLMGHERSFWMFYIGFGLGVSISLFMEGAVFWQLGRLAKTNATRLRPVIATFTVGYLAIAMNSWVHFFVGAVVIEVVIAACLVMAMVTATASD